jgi:oligoribonuclease
MQDADHLVWIDLEMTGLDPAEHVILEVAALVTDRDLNVLGEGLDFAVLRDEDVLARMEEWSQKTHNASGLVERVRASTIGIEEAAQRTLQFVQTWVPPDVAPLCGNSISHDRRFLRREMPGVDAYLSYRNIDVSSVKELVRRWYPELLHAPQKRETHRALDDIRESIGELRWYRERIFIAPPPAPSEAASPNARPAST